MPPTVSIIHYFSTENQQNRTEVLFHYSMQQHTSTKACFKHSDFFKVNVPSFLKHSVKRTIRRQTAKKGKCERRWPLTTPTHLAWDPTTSFLTSTNLIYAIGAGITAAAGTRLALQLVLVKGFRLYSFQLQSLVKSPALLFIVTTSSSWEWVICAPAAFLRCGSRF